MKRKDVLPVINTTGTTLPTEPGNKTQIKFGDILKKYRKKRNPNQRLQLETDPHDVKDYVDDDKEHGIQNEKFLVKIYESNYSSIIDKLRHEQELVKEESKNEEAPTPGFEKFGSTSYASPTTMKNFFVKYQQFKTLNRKQPIKAYTPSFAFIKSSNDELIVPNPLGLLKRGGNDYKLEMNNQKVGDNYVKVLSQSLRYINHLSSIELKGNRLTSSGTTSLFKSLNENKMLLYRIRDIDLSENKIGKNNIQEILNFIQDPKCSLEVFNIAGNKLGDDNIKQIADALTEYGKERIDKLNFGNNLIGDDSMESICNMLFSCTGLRVLILNWNKISNAGAAKLIARLREHSEMRILDIAWNNIGSDLTRDPKYEEIVNSDLAHPERIVHNYEIFEAINFTRKGLVFRRNPLLPPLDQKGSKKPPKPDKKKEDPNKKPEPLYKPPKPINVPPTPVSPFANELGNYFHQNNLSLIHLDISHNNLSSTDAKFLAEEIKDNHSILGIHCDGNEMEIDGLGFVSPLEYNKKEESYFSGSQIYYELGQDPTLTKTNVEAVRKIRSKNNCWICEGWREVEFEFTPEEPITDPMSHLIKIHLSFDNYKPFDMLCVGNKFQIVRMCPPGDVHYFFTVDTIPVIQEDQGNTNEVIALPHGCEFQYEFDNEYMFELNNIRAKLSYELKQSAAANENIEEEGSPEVVIEDAPPMRASRKMTRSITLTEPDARQKISVTISHLGKKHVKVNPNVINEDYRKMTKFTEPRPVKIINRFVKPRTPWTFPTSIWAYYDYNYDGDPESYLDQCFEHDFKRCQFNKDIKDDKDDVKYNELKELLRKRYRDIIDCYKYYASFSGFSVWQITQNNLTEFISTCPGMCDKTYDINNIFLTVKVVCANLLDRDERMNNKNKNLSDNIVRHQFMNLLVKAAKDKWVTTLKTTTDVLEAVKMTFEQSWDPAIKGFEYHSWRINRYYNEQVDNFLKAYLPIFDALYRSWAKQKGPRKKDVWMVVEEYNNLVCSFVDTNDYPVRENTLYFNWSIKLQINEINSDKHLNMYLPEFLEAISRAVDKDSPKPPDDADEDWPKEKRVNQPLINKLENIIERLIKLISHPDYKYLREKFPRPAKDLATGLYTLNYDSPYYQGYIIKAAAGKFQRKQTASLGSSMVQLGASAMKKAVLGSSTVQDVLGSASVKNSVALG